MHPKYYNIIYWGDLDAEGFEIFDNLLQYLPQAQALCMDEETLMAYKNEWINGSGATAKLLGRLPPMLRDVYKYVTENNVRLEQEQVSPGWVNNMQGSEIIYQRRKTNRHKFYIS